MSDQDWDWVNWYATRRHLPDHARVIRDRTWSLCGKTDIAPIEQHVKQRARWTDRPKDYAKVPRCKFCERKASKT